LRLIQKVLSIDYQSFVLMGLNFNWILQALRKQPQTR